MRNHRMILGALGFGIGAAAVLALSTASATPVPMQAFLRAFGQLLVVAAAAFTTGGLVGFVFGIPKLNNGHGAKDTHAERAASAHSTVDHNTNLGQVSDWLTKVLLGAGLVQITEIGAGLGKLSELVASGTAVPIAFMPPFIIYFSVLGFLALYIWTMTEFPGMVQKSLDKLSTEVSDLQRYISHWRNAWAVVEEQLHLETHESDRDAGKIVAALAPLDSIERARIFYHVRRVRQESERSGDHRRVERTIPIFEAMVDLDKEGQYHRNYAQLGYCHKAKPVPDFGKALDCLDMAIKIRDERRVAGWKIYEFNRGMCRIRKAVQEGPGPSPRAEQDAIIDDLVRAKDYREGASSAFDQLRKDESVQTWLHANRARLERSPLTELLDGVPPRRRGDARRDRRRSRGSAGRRAQRSGQMAA